MVQKRFSSSTKKSRQISVVIISRNREKYLRQTLLSLLKQTVSPGELVLIEDISEKQAFLQKTLANFLGSKITARYFPVRGGNYSKSRNLGINKSRFNLVLFLDDDILIPENYLEKIILCHNKYPQALGFVGKVEPLEKDLYSRFGSAFHMDSLKFASQVTPVSFYPTTAVSLNKSRVRKYKIYFDENLITGEDVDFFLKYYGKKQMLYFVPDLAVRHRFRSDFFSFFRRNYQYARDFAYLEKKHPWMISLEEYFPSRKLEFLFFPVFFLKFVVTRVKSVKNHLRLAEEFVPVIFLQAIANFCGVYTSRLGLSRLRQKFIQVFTRPVVFS